MLDNRIGRALDVGCGSGAMLVTLSQRGYDTVGADISYAMVRKAKELAFKLRTPESLMCVADIEELPFKQESFDLVVCAGVIEYLDKDVTSLTELSRVLKPNGTVLITVTNAVTPFWLLESALKVMGLWSAVVTSAKGGAQFPKARVHIPSALIRMAKKVDLIEVDRAYFHFTPLPSPLNLIFVNLCRRIGLGMEHLSKTSLGFIGRGCIMKFTKRTVKEDRPISVSS